MNTASQDLPRHFDILRERMLHPTDYETAIHYFLEEFAADLGFFQHCEPDPAPHLLALLNQVASGAMRKRTQLEGTKIFRCVAHGFYHGSGAVGERVALFIYLNAINTGVMALIPGVTGGMEVARFRSPTGLADPRSN